MKKFLVSMAAVAALATSAMAYDVADLKNYNASDFAGTGKASLKKTNTTQGNALIFPAYFVGNGWSSTIRIINTSPNAVVAKVVLYAGKDSHEVRDFNIYLSGNDEFIGKIYQDSDGKFVVESTDDSAPVEGTTSDPYPFATADNPLKKEIDSNYGYIQVIGMMEFTDNATNKKVSFHGAHKLMREVYTNLAEKERGVTGKTLVFNNGVILNNIATYPLVKLDQTSDIASDGNKYKDDVVATNALTGDIRITDETNGKDMVMPAIALNALADSKGGTTADSSLVFLEGEKANLADLFINQGAAGSKGAGVYSTNDLGDALENLSPKSVFMTYGDAEINNNYVLLTTPFKRIIVQQNKATAPNITAATDNKITFKGVEVDKTGAVTNYGYVDLLATIYDTNENYMGAGQFSPATTPTIKISTEVGNTGYDDTNSEKLPYYLKQAQAQGYNKGFVILQRPDNTQYIPGIVTQMIATKAGSRTVTNWIVPAQK